MSLRRLMQLPNETPNNVVVVSLHHVSELHFWNALSVGLYYVFKLLCHGLRLVGIHVSFKYQIKHQVFLVTTRRERRGVVWIISQQNFYYI